MRLLLDTHAFVWAVLNRQKLSEPARFALESETSEVLVSLVSAWEMAIKIGQGKWPAARSLLNNFEQDLNEAGFDLLVPTVAHVRMAGLMTSPHRDPFDRLLAAQAMIDGLSIVTADAKIAALGATAIW